MHTLHGQKYLWKLPSQDKQEIARIASMYNISFPVAQTLLTRGFVHKEAIDAFLFPSFERDVAHAGIVKDAQKAVDRILYAIAHKQKILICGDYDVDGITSSAMMLVCLMPLGADINFFLPHRVKDGYGLSVKTVERAAANDYKLLITVDDGITAFNAAVRAKELGIDLIITDHHRAHEHLPDAFAIVNPNQVNCPYPFKVLAGVGVTFKLLSLLYEQKKLQLPSKVYELLMLGTIADVVPLLGENRFWVRHGLHHVNQIESLSFKVLKQNGKIIKDNISATDIGFSIAPQINALGRLQDARDGVKFLIGNDERIVQHVGSVLLELNEVRKQIERSIYQHVVEQIECKRIDIATVNIIMAASDAWPPGVIGLVASRLVAAYGKPTLLFHLSDKLAKGSCRSIASFNMFDALVQNRDILTSFGGHSLAAGLALPVDKLNLLKDNLESLISKQLTPEDLKQKIEIDAVAFLSDANKKCMTDLQYLEPFGNENKSPIFYFGNICLLQEPQLLKDAHVKCNLFADGIVKPVIFFNRPELHSLLCQQGKKPFSLVAHMIENYWNGKVSIELSGIDIALN